MKKNLSLGFPIRSNTNQAVQPQKIARGLKFQIVEVKGLYYLCSKNKASIQLCDVTAQLICIFIFGYAKSRFLITHISLESFLWEKGKPNSPRSDAAKRGVPSRAILFVIFIFIAK